MTRLFYTTGKQDIIHEEWDKPEITSNEIEVKSVFTGMCRSDIDMYCGTFQLLPKTIQGHESVGIVTKVGNSIRNIKEGDFVATRGEPAFADYYNCPDRMFVKIPELLPKYIIEPVACAINIANSLRFWAGEEILIMGSGFLSTVVYTYLSNMNTHQPAQVTVVGNSNKEFWNKQTNAKLVSVEEVAGKKFKYVIDISEKPEYLDLNLYAERATIILAAEKHPAANITFGQFLWNATNIKFPSPRNEHFYSYMEEAVSMIQDGLIDVSTLWCKSYDRETEVELAFSEGLHRAPGYGRGYINYGTEAYS
jgi:D-arabinose 1-dehydrogenase-like Zn-dependent alcohol dehydrogenase